jgi:lantibiotic modifying enzyme
VAREANDAVPAFTKRIARGVAIAEDPAPGASFGAERCLLVAEGLVEAYERGERDVTGRLRCVAEMFTEAAISLDAPYLNPGSGDIYEVIEAKEQAPRKQRRSHAGDDVSEAVGRIGAWLCREAIWHEDRCTWMGEPPDSHAGRRLQSLDGDLYAGTSGIALFLARLAARSGDATARDHALGAVHHALTRVDRLRSADRNGLYDGSIGVAVAVAEVGLLLGDSELSERARSVARETAAALAADSAEDDLLGGRAGVIAGLLRLSEVLGEASVLEPVSRLSWELVTRAAARRGGVAWRSRRLEREQPLTGVSHGAAGIGLALVEAFAATGEAAFRDVAEAAFAYEQAWFNAEAGNWRDLRGVTRPGPQDLLACATDWCHGAPGIAVSRLEAHRVLGDEGLKQEAVTGLETTLRRVWESLDGGLGATGLCLCHGPLSCAEVLTLGARYFGNSRYREVALAFGSTLASWVKLEDAGAWQDAWQPGLMTGAAGAGYFLLRLLDPEIPSLLMPGVGTKSVVAGA